MRRNAQRILVLCSGFAVAWLVSDAAANGIYRNGVGARAMSLGGADVAWAEDPLGALSANPAGLGFLQKPTLNLGFVGAVADGDYSNSVNDDGRLRNAFVGLPEGALGMPLGSSPVKIGLGVYPESTLVADWKYVDPPGGADGATSYGQRKHDSEILVVRSALGVGVEVSPKLSLGASVGLIYNENTLEAPYIFQNEPKLPSGFKTLLDLHTWGFGWNVNAGVLFRPHETVQLGAAYQSETVVHSQGDAFGNASTQLANLGLGGARPDFHYDAEVLNVFPQMVSGGVSWKFHPRWRLALQLDWINWSDAFNKLRINLRDGNNADINGVVGSDSLGDKVPLKWEDRFVYRGGIEFAVTDYLLLRGGYLYGKSPVPDGTLTPLTAAIMEHTVTAGVGYRRGPFGVDLAYQWDLPVTQNVNTSKLLAGEYSNSRVEVGIHWVALTTSYRF